ncbi:conserved Plasmodium protein, unknown function [Plasmodium gallinaceum]|uniref:Uncharacterized protein n=1 Tax=Plasmodium gallinaceum TaxID=5849 RepID=A0A1J1GSC3_PLAGA|nr:conserved Plasmodium protein, unknown function [Plasmodium gallinaceum]CRG95411.1 conserved Plasmodium protein, unknown function [Plasmodium gallinaceum]
MTEESKMNVKLKIDKEIPKSYKKVKDFDDNEYNKFLINIMEIKQNDDIKENKDFCKGKYDIITTDSISTTTDEISNIYHIENKGDEKERFVIHEEKNYSNTTNILEENTNKIEENNNNQNSDYVSINNITHKYNIKELNIYQDNNNSFLYNNSNNNIQNFINQENEINKNINDIDIAFCVNKKLNNVNLKNEYNTNYYIKNNIDDKIKKYENAMELTYKNENFVNHNLYSNNINNKYISNNINYINKNSNIIKHNLNNNNLNNLNKSYNTNVNIKNDVIHNNKINDKSSNLMNYFNENNKSINDIINLKNIRNIDNFSHFTYNDNNRIRRVNNKSETMNNINTIKSIRSVNNLNNISNMNDLTVVNNMNNFNCENNNMYFLNMKFNKNTENDKIRSNTNISKDILEKSHNNLKNSQIKQDKINHINKNEDKLKFLKNNSVAKKNVDIKDSMNCVIQMNNVNDANKNNYELKNTSILSNNLVDKLKNIDVDHKNNKNQFITKKEMIFIKDNKNNNELYSSSINLKDANNNKNAIKKISKRKKDLNNNSYKKLNDENYKIIKSLIQKKNIINNKYINAIPKYDLKDFSQNNKCIEKEYKELLHLEQNAEVQKVINNKKKIILTKFELKIFLLNTIKAIGIVLKNWKLKKFGLYFWFHIKCIENELDLSFYINIFNFLFEIITGRSIYCQSNDINNIVKLFKEFIIYDCKNIFKKSVKILNKYAKKNSSNFSIFENNEDIIKLNKSLLLNEDELNTNNKKNNFYDYLFNTMKETNDFFEKNGQEDMYFYNIFANFNELNYNEIFNFYIFYNNELNKSKKLLNDNV